MIDVTHQISAVQRTLGTRTVDAGEARIVTLSRSYDAEIDDVWDALTNPERIPRWFLPVTGELKVGGHYQLEGNASGTVEACDRPHSFAATWEYGGDVSWIEVRLTAEPGDRTRFTLEHTAHVDDERWAEFGPGAVGVGWDLGLWALEQHLRTKAPVDENAWTATADGKQFMTLSSERWFAAALAAGTSEAEARAAADRTAAAYTAGEDPTPAET